MCSSISDSSTSETNGHSPVVVYTSAPSSKRREQAEERRAAEPPADSVHLVIGFDAEWVRADRIDESLPPTENVLLSWQFAVFDPTGERSVTLMFYPEHASRRGRYMLRSMLSEAIAQAVKHGVIDELPPQIGKRISMKIVVAGHFLRADLTTVRDFPLFKNNLDSVRKTFATTTRPTTMTLYGRETAITFADTMLLAPQGTSLATLGETIGIQKVELPPGAIERMDLLLEEDRELFQEYAMRDAVIAAKYYIEIWKVIRTKLGVTRHAATLSNVAQQTIIGLLKNLKIDPDYFFGYVRIRGRRHNLLCLASVLTFAANCYHGGRNEAYFVGPTPEGLPLYDLDLKGAYTTGLALVQVPNWSSAKPESDIDRLAVVTDAMTFARVSFQFPDGMRFPSLPVRAGDRGLIYPLSGTSWCCGPELVVALEQGAEIIVEEGWRVEWVPGSVRPFEHFARTIADTRAAAKASGDKLLDHTFKEVGNSAYGRVAQAVHPLRTVRDHGVDGSSARRSFNARTAQMEDIGPSQITCPLIAAYITSLVRAALSEPLAAMPNTALVASATTDGILSSVPIERLDVSGPVANAFATARKAIDGDPKIWTEKGRIGRALVIKTRGCLTLEPYQAGDEKRAPPIMARCGHKMEKPLKAPADDTERLAQQWQENAHWLSLHHDRDYETQCLRSSLTPLLKQFEQDADLVEELTMQRVNFDFDMKRAPVEPTDCEGVLCAETRPWPTVDDFEAARGDGDRVDGLEGWKRSRRRVLKTASDYRDMIDWIGAREDRIASGASPHTNRPRLVDAFIRAMAHQRLGVKWPQARLVEVLAQTPFPVTIDSVKKAKRRAEIEPHEQLTAAEEAFAEAIYRTDESLPLEPLVVPGSAAAAALERAKSRAASASSGK